MFIIGWSLKKKKPSLCHQQLDGTGIPTGKNPQHMWKDNSREAGTAEINCTCYVREQISLTVTLCL